MRARLLSSLLLAVCTVACSTAGAPDDPWGGDGKGDGWASERTIDVVMNEPYCDVCSAEDKAFLQGRSPMVAKLVALIDGAQTTIDVANFTFSVRAIEEALLRAKTRGVAIRVAMDKGQEMADTVATRLSAAGVPVRFVAGGGSPAGLQHAKFMIVDQLTLQRLVTLFEDLQNLCFFDVLAAIGQILLRHGLHPFFNDGKIFLGQISGSDHVIKESVTRVVHQSRPDTELGSREQIEYCGSEQMCG